MSFFSTLNDMFGKLRISKFARGMMFRTEPNPVIYSDYISSLGQSDTRPPTCAGPTRICVSVNRYVWFLTPMQAATPMRD